MGYPLEPRTLGEHLRKCRLDRGLKQRIVAEMLGVREETVHLWERGHARPLPRHQGAILRFLGYDPEPSEPTLGGRLKALRRRLGLTQAELADLVGLDEGTLCQWESGRGTPSRWRAARLAKSLERLEASISASADHEQFLRGPVLPSNDAAEV